MTFDHAIAIFKAAKRGKPIEFRYKCSLKWDVLADTDLRTLCHTMAWGYQMRVKRKRTGKRKG